MRRGILTSILVVFLFVITLITKSCGVGNRDRVYVIGRDKSWYPLNLLGKEKNMLGFTDDLIYTIADMEGLEVNLDSTSHNAMLENLQRGVFDAIITFSTPTERLRRSYIFSNSYFNIGPVLVVPSDSGAKSIEDMKGKVIGIQTRASMIYDINELPDIIFTPFENILFALRNLAEGHIDGVILENVPAHEYVESFYKGELKVIPPPLTQRGLRLMTLNEPKEKNLIDHFNRGLEKLKEDGTYRQLLEKWGLYDPDTYTGVPPEPEQ